MNNLVYIQHINPILNISKSMIQTYIDTNNINATVGDMYEINGIVFAEHVCFTNENDFKNFYFNFLEPHRAKVMSK